MWVIGSHQRWLQWSTIVHSDASSQLTKSDGKLLGGQKSPVLLHHEASCGPNFASLNFPLPWTAFSKTALTLDEVVKLRPSKKKRLSLETQPSKPFRSGQPGEVFWGGSTCFKSQLEPSSSHRPNLLRASNFFELEVKPQGLSVL